MATAVPSGELDTAVRRAREGDEAAFLALWRELQPRLLRFLRVYAGGEPDDVAAETWLQVVRDLPRFSGDAVAFRRWLFTVARHRAIDAGRARAARPLVLIGDAREAADGAVASAEQQVMDGISTSDAIALLRTLPAAQAELIALRVLADLDAGTVAAIVGSTPGAVRVGVHRGLKTLSRQLVPAPLEAP